MVTSNSILANPRRNPSVSFLLAVRLVTVIPDVCEMHSPANVLTMVAHALAPNRHQYIANHHLDSSSIFRVYQFTLTQHTHPIAAIKQTILERGWFGNMLVPLSLTVGSSSYTHSGNLCCALIIAIPSIVNISWHDYCIWNQFCVQFGHITAEFFFLLDNKICQDWMTIQLLKSLKIFFIKFMQLVTFCLKLFFIYVDICTMWGLGYPYILYFVLHRLNSMNPSNKSMHLWNDVIAVLDGGLLTIGAKALSG